MSMLTTLRARDRRAVIAGMSIIGALIIVARGLPAIQQRDRNAETRLHEVAVSLSRERLLSAAVARYGRLKPERDSIAITQGPAALTSSTPAAGVASLASRVMGLARYVGAKVSTTTPHGDSVFTNGSAVIGLRVSMVVDGRALIDFLNAIESGPEVIVVRSLSIIQPEAGVEVEARRSLRVDLLLNALAKQADAKPVTGDAGAH